MKSGRFSSGIEVFAIRILFLLLFFLAWQAAAQYGLLQPILFGKPSGIVAFLWREIFVTGGIWTDFFWSMAGTLVSFAIGSVAGILAGMLFVSQPRVEAVFEPILAALNAMPRIALAPLFIIWFGLGLGSKVALGVSLTFFIVLSSTVAGGRGVNPDHLTLAQTLGATKAQVFRKFIMPGAIPVIFNGLRLGLVYALLGVIGAEILAAEHGLGQRLSVLAASFETNGVFAILILLSLVGVTINGFMTFIERRLLVWR